MKTWTEVKARILEELDLPELPPYHCEKCGVAVSPETDTYKDCRAGNCQIVCCGHCGHEWASFGPVGCPCQSRDPKLRRIRAMYRARRR